MKFNKWTVALAAVGVVSLASAARADEKMSAMQTALSDTTISGYVSASANWELVPTAGVSSSSPAGFIPFQGITKQDGFNLDVVKLSISKPQDESPWASGYQADLIFGPDAVAYNTSANSGSTADFAIKQAYIALRTPVGNGIDWKIGVFDTIIGYEVFDAGSNPNYTRSYGYAIEPTEHTGILGTYKINDELSVSAGVANTLSAGINARAATSGFGNGSGSDWHKTLMASTTFTAPSSWGWMSGSSFYAGVVYGINMANAGAGLTDYQANWYLGATMNTPLKQLTTGFALDYVSHFAGTGVDVWSIGTYATYKANDKLSFSGRAEYIEGDIYNLAGTGGRPTPSAYELTATVEYDMWANVVSRVELRWDDITDNKGSVGIAHGDSLGLYANVIYKF